jgi:general secretion pathway protein K
MKPRAHTQNGAALLVAMVILTLVTTLAAGMVWQQWRAIQVEAAERTRAQAAWILTGALDMGRRLGAKRHSRTTSPLRTGSAMRRPCRSARISPCRRC